MKRPSLLQLKETFPCLGEALNPDNYSERLHTLLFLEEIENIYRLNQFNIENGLFRRYCGKFLSLVVEGLSEKRPSLVVGDKVIVRPSTYKGLLHSGFCHLFYTSDYICKWVEKLCLGKTKLL